MRSYPHAPIPHSFLLFVCFSFLACFVFPFSASAATFTPLDLKPIVNMDWQDEKAGDGRGGWTDQGSSNDMRNVQVGRRTFLAIPFELIDPAANEHKAVLTLHANHFRAGPESASVPVNAQARAIYFLHAAAWNTGHMATYLVTYDDHTTVAIPIRANQEVCNWWSPTHGNFYRVAFQTTNGQSDNVGMVVFGWDNPAPAKTIESIEIKSENGEGVLVLAAITLSDQPVNFPDPKDIPTPDYLKSDLDTLDATQWFPVESKRDPFGPTPIDMAGTLDAPAGKHGFMRAEKGRFVFEDNSPVRLCATVQTPFAPPTRAEADYIARWLAKWGFNMVRFHALQAEVIDAKRPDTQHLDPAVMDRLDYFIAQLAKQGIYCRFSMLYYRHMKKGDNIDGYAEAAEEALANARKKKPSATPPTSLATTGITFFNPQVMQLNIALETAIMTHRNPYRNNVMYGQDPAICQIETTNEDGMFFYTIDAIPTVYKKELDQLFGAWLLKKYGSREKLAAAWSEGEDTDLGDSEDPGAGNVKRLSIYTFNKVSETKRPRARDQLRFYAELNNAYFTKTKETLRAAGVKQPINGTCWFGIGVGFWPEQFSNVANMDSIDRHHYWGGGPGEWQILPNQLFHTQSALKQPELLLKLGAERVVDLPYTISEWTNALPNQWRLEAAPLMAFYGNSLGGWDAPMQFAHNVEPNAAGFTRYLKWMWPVNDPSTLCQYPALSQIIRRYDIKEGPPAFVRHLSQEQVFSAQPIPDAAVKIDISGLYEMSSAEGLNAKSLAVLYAAGVGKTGVHFAPASEPDFSLDLTQYIDLKKKEIRSATGELFWNYDRGYVTVNTPRVQGAVGFLGNVPITLADCSLATSNVCCSILITSWDGQPLKESKHILVTAIGRSRNSGMAYTRLGTRLLELGKEPLLLEGVKGAMVLHHGGTPTVTALGPLGYKTGDVTPSVAAGRITIPLSGANKAVYYEIKFE